MSDENEPTDGGVLRAFREWADQSADALEAVRRATIALDNARAAAESVWIMLGGGPLGATLKAAYAREGDHTQDDGDVQFYEPGTVYPAGTEYRSIDGTLRVAAEGHGWKFAGAVRHDEYGHERLEGDQLLHERPRASNVRAGDILAYSSKRLRAMVAGAQDPFVFVRLRDGTVKRVLPDRIDWPSWQDAERWVAYE